MEVGVDVSTSLKVLTYHSHYIFYYITHFISHFCMDSKQYSYNDLLNLQIVGHFFSDSLIPNRTYDISFDFNVSFKKIDFF